MLLIGDDFNALINVMYLTLTAYLYTPCMRERMSKDSIYIEPDKCTISQHMGLSNIGNLAPDTGIW
jgi:hypothetical protein